MLLKSNYPGLLEDWPALVFRGPRKPFNIVMLLLLSNSTRAKMKNSDVIGLEIIKIQLQMKKGTITQDPFTEDTE